AAAERTDADPGAAPEERDRARRTLTASLVELREAGDTAAGEWWQRALPEQRLLAAERAGHRTLAATAHRRGPGGAAPPAVHAPSIGAE
ncbi:FUSC family protein, partial [Streptomyces anulatus]|nr:FUSC family protein [Streptomyces anulatus]